MIGNETLLNEGIKRILTSEEGFEVYHIAPEHIDQHDFKSPKPKFRLTLLDLCSFPERSASCIKKIRTKTPTDYLVAMHSDSYDSAFQKLLSSEVDSYLPLDVDTDMLIQTVSRFKSKS
jgi:DNA-binding NarL/FixJ family response regulator